MKNTMRRLWLDYQRPMPGRQWPGLLLLVASLLFGVWLLGQSLSISRQLSAIEQEVSRLKQQAERRRLLGVADEPARDAAEQAERQRSPFNIPWESLLLALEKAMDDSVTLLGLEPGVRDILIAGEARDINALLDYLKRLQAATLFVDVHLIKHEVIKESPYRPVRFSLQATWREILP